MIEPTSAGWYRDPFGRHERRYHTGTGWTEHVRDRGRAAIDPPRARAPEPRVPLRITAPLHPSAPATEAGGGARVAIADEPLTMRDWASAPGLSRPTAPTGRATALRPHRTGLIFAVIAALGIGIGAVTGLVLTAGGSSSPPVTTTRPVTTNRAAHTVTAAAYQAVPISASRARVLELLGHQPVPRAELLRAFPGAKFDPACLYFYGPTVSTSYAFCFTSNGALATKSIRSR